LAASGADVILSDLGLDNTAGAETNITLAGQQLQIDLNGDGVFGAAQDFAIDVTGASDVIFHADQNNFVIEMVI
jgi:hypothetical protein